MELNQGVLGKFVGGQIEVQDNSGGDQYCGEIKAIRIEGEGKMAELVIGLAWMAKNEHVPPIEDQWTKDNTAIYRILLLGYTVKDIRKDRISLSLPDNTDRLIVLYPRGLQALDRSKVKGL